MSFQKLIKTNLLLFIVIIVLELLFAAGSATSSYIIQFAYNQLVKNILIGFLIIIASSVFLSFVSYIFSSLATYLFSKQTQKYIHSIRHKLISKYFHDKEPKVAEMENELNSNLQVLTKNYADKSLIFIGYIYWQPSSNELDAYIIGINSISYYTLHSSFYKTKSL